MLSKLRIGPKLLLAPCTILLLMIVVAAASALAMQRQNASLEAIVGQQATRLRETAELVHVAQRAHTEVYQLHAWLGGSFAAPRLAALQRSIAADQLDASARLQRLIAATRTNRAEQRLVQQASGAHTIYLKAVADVIELARADASTSANAMLKAELAFATVAARLADLSRLERSLSEQAAAEAARDFNRMTTIMGAIVLLSIVLSLAITVAVRRVLLREVADIGEAARDLASGQLRVREHTYGGDEIAATSRMLDTSIRNLNATMSHVLASARAIDDASRRVAADNADLSRRTQDNAHSLQHTASSVEELTAVLSQTATSARAANRLAASAGSVASRGSDGVERLLRTMGALRRNAGAAAANARRIYAIANQAGILALDAAVEAGRAGQHGAAFAGVAAQMRTLAQESSQAARDIADLMVVAVADIDGGSAVAAQAGDSIALMARDVAQVRQLIDVIGNASGKQASGIEEVSAAIVQMDQMTQQNCAMVTAAARAAAELQRQAGALTKTVAGFNLDGSMARPISIINARRNAAHLRLASSRL